MYDVMIVGGGAAGLSAAVMLGRARRSILVIDQGNPRNQHADAMHGYLTRDGINPNEFLKLGRDELRRYGVHVLQDEVIAVRRRRNRFEVRTHGGERFQSRKL